MNNLDKQYIALLNDILANGVKKEDRTGTGTISVFGRQIRHKMSEGFPLLTTKKMPFKTIATELIWFLRGDTNIKYLVENGCNIWNGDAYKNYCKYTSANSSEWNKWMRDNGDGSLSMFTQEEFIDKIKTDDEFAKKWGQLGPIYGKQWRNWDWYEFDDSVKKVDQIQNLINDLKTNPDSRRLMVNAWNVTDLPVTDYRTDDELYQDYLKDFEKK
jgi:thymidylate synthase